MLRIREPTVEIADWWLVGKNVRTSQNVDHIRATENLSIGPIVQYYCVTGNADEDVRV